MGFNISDLKKHLGPGLGLRKNKYLIEIPVPTIDGQTLNILCQSAGLPERNITTTDIWHKGRRYTVRGETDFVGEYEISIVDDSEMKIRQLFDKWIKQIDNTRPNKNNSLLGGSYEVNELINEVSSAVALANEVRSAIENPNQLLDFAIGLFDTNLAGPSASYQTDINIWQLDNKNNKVYGYKLQNAFPKSIGIVTLEDAEENTLSEFSVTFAFSEFVPLKDTTSSIIGGILGDQSLDTFAGIGQLVS